MAVSTSEDLGFLLLFEGKSAEFVNLNLCLRVCVEALLCRFVNLDSGFLKVFAAAERDRCRNTVFQLFQP